LGESLYAEVYPVAPIPHSIRTGWIASTPLFYYDIGEMPGTLQLAENAVHYKVSDWHFAPATGAGDEVAALLRFEDVIEVHS
jgi:hypothetical protein